MEKRKYVTPAMEELEIDAILLLDGSDGVFSDDIGYGGVDETGEYDPE